LRVRDHGPGIEGPEAARLFQPFTKSAAEAAHTAAGVGLGLALSRRLARQLGGDLQLENGGQQGASFALTLPLSASTNSA
ncbi:MAG: ATP-binding protein, partial [Planctomycetota bacterium]|nr:ATP-binding protein [Planctomycetota bacterium]